MSTAAREAEARAADLAFQVALAQIGAGTVEDALALWRNLDPTDVAATTEGWLTRAVRLILGRRRISRDLAMAYYRLARALRTGKTIADPFHPEPTYVTLGDLRRQFRELVADIDYIHQPQNEAAQAAATAAAGGDGAQTGDEFGGLGPQAEPKAEDGDNDRIQLEQIERLREEEMRLETEAEKAAQRDLEQLGPIAMRGRLRDVKPDTTLQDAQQRVSEENRKAGARVAASSERLVLNGGRGSVWSYAGRDKRVVAWARVSLSGNPCHFCAMLISRGAIYKSEAAATYSDGDLYHDNCHCIAVPIYSKAQYETDPRFDQNRELERLWPIVTKGYGGTDARNAWRRYIEGARRSGDATWVTTVTDSPYSTTKAVQATA